MSRLIRPVAWAMAAAAVAASVVAAAVIAVAAGRGIPDAPNPWEGLPLVVGVGAPACVGLVLLLRRPGTRVAWILLAGALSVALVMAAVALGNLALEDDPRSSAGPWLLLLAQEWVVLFLWPLALAYLFPDGRLPSPRWRLPAALALASGAGALLLLPLQPTLAGPEGDVTNPLTGGAELDFLVPVFWACWFGLLLSLFGGALALRARYRAGSRERRRQVLWLAYGAVLPPLWLGGTSLVSLLFGASASADLAVLMLVHVWLAVAVAVAVTRHGLYEIDRLFNRTLVYGVLTALLAGTYALVALVAGQLAGGSALAASAGTLAAALAFRPLRDRLQAVVDRRFARRRVEAVRLMRDFLDDVRDGRSEPEDVGAALALALDDARAEVVFRLPETGAYADRHGHVLDALPEDGRARSAIGHDHREVGVLLHDPALAERPDVLASVLDAAAVAVELGRLRVELRLQLAEVESSRTRIAQAGYEERRRLERDLHDGAQQRLVTLGIVLRRLQRSLPGEAKILAPAFDAAVDEVAATIGDLRTIAAGLRPPRLDEGLTAALEDLARAAAVPVELQATGERAPPEVEAVAYYIACEALTNAVKHAAPSRVSVQTTRTPESLRLVVADDGIGGAAPGAGSGLAGMVNRVAAQGGRLALDSPAGAGTRIDVELPCVS
ncbi:MAG TPA: histidine kinase [Solirubrobacteraceae bacterium]|nr:histidine kinase [Solirubrobacteraceae bacterium]